MKAYEVLEQHDLCKGWFARNAEGKNVPFYDLAACSFCTVGAIDKAYEDVDERNKVKYKLETHLLNTVNDYSIARWSDHPDRSKEDIIKVLKELDI